MPTVECVGETFEVHGTISAWGLADFAEATAAAGDADMAKSIAAMMTLLKDCIVETEWERFKTVTRAKRASFDDLFQIIKDMSSANAERPTGRSSDSSDGPTATGQRSGLSSEDRALEMSGLRPDQKLAVMRTRGVA